MSIRRRRRNVGVSVAAPAGNAGIIKSGNVWYADSTRAATPDDYPVNAPSGSAISIDTVVGSGLAVNITSNVVYVTL